MFSSRSGTPGGHGGRSIASAHTAEVDANDTEIDFQKEGGIIEIEVGSRLCCPQCGEITY